MNRRQNTLLTIIIFLIVLALWIDLSKIISIANPINDKILFSRNVEVRLGLDLRGGLQTLLEADLPVDAIVSGEDLRVTRQILENRSNALGVSEVVMQTAGDRRIVAEFPGISNPEEVIASLQQTGLLEFVDFGTTPIAEGTNVQTDYEQSIVSQPTGIPEPTETATNIISTPSVTETSSAATTMATETPIPQIYHTLMTGASLDIVNVVQDNLGQYQISFTLKKEAVKLFGDYTGSHIGQYLGIVLDKYIISMPVIKSEIGDGQGVIQGSFTRDSANTLAVQLRYGSLPIPIKVVESRTVGPTLGEESVRKSILAGLIGLTVVILFMALYYRLPGILADCALLVYAMLTLMLLKLIPVVLTLP
ncbi:MAG: hypothetical protein MUP03_09185, partial [Anaerolineales bacterium]|nr:hypothetical protein [Anaerolineales bacterium]